MSLGVKLRLMQEHADFEILRSTLFIFYNSFFNTIFCLLIVDLTPGRLTPITGYA